MLCTGLPQCASFLAVRRLQAVRSKGLLGQNEALKGIDAVAAEEPAVAQLASGPSDAVRAQLMHRREAEQVTERLSQAVLGAPGCKAGFTSGRQEAQVRCDLLRSYSCSLRRPRPLSFRLT